MDQVAGWVLGQINPLSWLQSAWTALSGSLLRQITGFLTSTSGPLSLEGVTSSQTVLHYATLTRLIADAALAGVLVWAFLGVMWHQASYQRAREPPSPNSAARLDAVLWWPMRGLMRTRRPY